LLIALIVPYPFVAALFNRRASLADSPQGFGDRSGVIEVIIRVLFLNRISGSLGFVVRDGRIEVVCDVGSTNLMVQEVNGTKRVHLIVGSVNRVQRSLDIGMVFIRKVRNIDIGMLEPTETRKKSEK
jgi:hypothetical protein